MFILKSEIFTCISVGKFASQASNNHSPSSFEKHGSVNLWLVTLLPYVNLDQVAQ